MKKVLLSVFLGLLIAPNANAVPSCGSSLMPAFTANQATQLCKTFGSAVSQSLIPSASNTYDLGSASLPWRTLYTGTSRIALTSDILRVRQDAQRLFTWDASSDVLLTQTFGDAGTTAVQFFTISASTADADDDSTLVLAGGGAAGGTRGASITLPGEEVSGGSDITYTAGTSDTHIFTAAATTLLTIGADAVLTVGAGGGLSATSGNNLDLKAVNGFVDIYTGVTPTRMARFSTGDMSLTTSGTVALQEATAGTKCMGTVTASGTTAVSVATTCATTGSRIFITRSSAPSGTAQCWQTNIVTGTSFDLDCDGAETGTFDWIIIHEAA